MFSTLEYLTKNSLRSFPFKDDDTLEDTTALFDLDQSTFLDALVISKVSTATSAYLSTLSRDATNFTFGITLIDSLGADITTISFTKAISSVVALGTITYSNASASIKLVAGDGLVTLGTAPVFSHSFLRYATEIVADAFIPYMPLLSSIQFNNTDPADNSEVIVAVVSSDDLEFDAGSNIDVIPDNGKASLAVIPGYGTGLYDGCSGKAGIKTINFIPSNRGQFSIAGDGCYTTSAITHGIQLINSCTPKCTHDQMVNWQHYYNRLKDATLYMADTYVPGVQNIIVGDPITGLPSGSMNDFYLHILPTRNVPNFVGSYLDFYSYYSFAVSFYNPPKTLTPFSLDVTVDTTSGHSSNMILVPKFGTTATPYATTWRVAEIKLPSTDGSQKIVQVDGSTSPSSFTITGYSIPCRDYATLDFTIQQVDTTQPVYLTVTANMQHGSTADLFQNFTLQLPSAL